MDTPILLGMGALDEKKFGKQTLYAYGEYANSTLGEKNLQKEAAGLKAQGMPVKIVRRNTGTQIYTLKEGTGVVERKRSWLLGR